MSEWHYFKRKYEGTVNWKFQCVRGGVEQWGRRGGGANVSCQLKFCIHVAYILHTWAICQWSTEWLVIVNSRF